MKTLTFADALHPESAAAYSDNNDPPSWERFFQEARGDMPVAIAERVEDSEASNAAKPNQVPVETGDVTNTVEDGAEDDERPSSPRWEGCFYLEGLVGGILALAVVLGVFFTELVAAIVFLLAVGFHTLAKIKNMPIFFQAVFHLLTQVLMVVDAVCLLASVLITEVLGLVTGIVMFIVCALTGECGKRASAWVIYIRKIAHLSRYTFRSFHHGWEPERTFPFGHEGDVDDDENRIDNGCLRPSMHSSNPTAGQKGGNDDDEAMVIETSATFVIEPLDGDPALGDADETNQKLAWSTQTSSSSPPSLQAHPVQVAHHHTSIARAPPGPGDEDAGSPTSSYVMADDMA